MSISQLLSIFSRKHLMLTTFPKHRSRNVGDALIASSFLALVQHLGLAHSVETKFRADPLDDKTLKRYGSRPIFLPGMSVSNDLYPKLYALHSDFDRIPRSLIPFGCSWQHPVGFPEHFEQAVVTGDTKRLLLKIVEATGRIAVRDSGAEGILARNGIPAVTVGDCAWYHLPSIGKPMRTTGDIKRIAITTPHHAPLEQQSLGLLKLAREMFPAADISVVSHSNPTLHETRILSAASSIGASVVDAAGDLSIFDRYEEFDLHVGHRLHGHIGFIRRRIPSVLIAEDARSRGFSKSIPTGVFFGYRPGADGPVADDSVTGEIGTYLESQIRVRFEEYGHIAPFLDAMLYDVVLPELRTKYRLASESARQVP